jgi:hypothetical protein
MAVDHYEVVYADSSEDSMNAEFGADLFMVSEAGNFSPVIKQRLLAAAQQCIHCRPAFLVTLKDEFTKLKDAQSPGQDIREAITEIDSTESHGNSDTELTDRCDTPPTINDECKSWLQRRQEEIHANRSELSAHVDAYTRLRSHLYEALEVDLPVFATFVDILEIISRYE